MDLENRRKCMTSFDNLFADNLAYPYKELNSKFKGLKEFLNILIPKMEYTPDEIKSYHPKSVNPDSMELAVAIKDYIDTGDDFRFRQIL